MTPTVSEDHASVLHKTSPALPSQSAVTNSDASLTRPAPSLVTVSGTHSQPSMN